MINLVKKIWTTGRVAEPAPPRSTPTGRPSRSTGTAGAGGATESVHDRGAHGDATPTTTENERGGGCPKAAALRGSVQLRHVDAGSCNGCEIEIGAAFGPVHDAERFGARLVASPRHADALLVTGVVTRNMAGPLRTTYEALPEPRIVVAVGDCARDRGEFAEAYGVLGAVGDVVPVDLEVPGCPPPPETIVAALRELTGR